MSTYWKGPEEELESDFKFFGVVNNKHLLKRAPPIFVKSFIHCYNTLKSDKWIQGALHQPMAHSLFCSRNSLLLHPVQIFEAVGNRSCYVMYNGRRTDRRDVKEDSYFPPYQKEMHFYPSAFFFFRPFLQGTDVCS